MTIEEYNTTYGSNAMPLMPKETYKSIRDGFRADATPTQQSEGLKCMREWCNRYEQAVIQRWLDGMTASCKRTPAPAPTPPETERFGVGFTLEQLTMIHRLFDKGASTTECTDAIRAIGDAMGQQLAYHARNLELMIETAELRAELERVRAKHSEFLNNLR